jgi:hypothetical protein
MRNVTSAEPILPCWSIGIGGRKIATRYPNNSPFLPFAGMGRDVLMLDPAEFHGNPPTRPV